MGAMTVQGAGKDEHVHLGLVEGEIAFPVGVLPGPARRIEQGLALRIFLISREGHPLRCRVELHHVILDRKSTRLNSSHRCISYAVFCLNKTNILLTRYD